jgi:dolichol-phosphate mannosyltransferase
MPGTCTIVIPTYNEEKNIAEMAKALRRSYPEFRVLFMDDNSVDSSRELIESLGDPMVRFYVRDPEERGLAASVMQGFLICGTDYFINMDCDFQHPLSALGPIYEKLESGDDLVVGTRSNRMIMGFKRGLGSWIFNFWYALTLKLHGKQTTTDLMSGLVGGRTDVFKPEIEAHGNEMELQGWKVLADLLKYSGRRLKIGKVEYKFEPREVGESHLDDAVVIRSFHQMWGFGKVLAKFYAKIKGIDYYGMYPKEKRRRQGKSRRR